MIIDLNETTIRTLEQVRAVLDGTEKLEFAPATDTQARYAWVESVLRRFGYGYLKRPERGLILRYLRRFSGFSRAQLTRLVQRWLDG
ncbi:integrase, catalytic region, partial [Burkholderia sp. H160]